MQYTLINVHGDDMIKDKTMPDCVVPVDHQH